METQRDPAAAPAAPPADMPADVPADPPLRLPVELPADWDGRAGLAQRSLEFYFGAPGVQLLNNRHPLAPGDNDVFNYWWLAHVIDARVDAYHRTGDEAWLRRARAVRDNILLRNNGSPINDYFDDILWYALAVLRLSDAAGGDPQLRDEAIRIWRHVRDHGWNDHEGGGVAWRVQQPYYKNTPANGPFIILSARLFARTKEPAYLEWARRTMDWLEGHLVRPDGFVEDGVNRLGDHAIDTAWRFTYNQGLYIGARVELARVTGEPVHLPRATRTAHTAIAELAPDGVFLDEGEGGDEGLFKGIFYRYATDLAVTTGDAELSRFLLSCADRLWTDCLRPDSLLAGNDWRRPPEGPVHFSTQLSAIMATEACALLARTATGR